VTQHEVEYVQQRADGCFPAVVAMLTGIDYDVLPNETFSIRPYFDRPQTISEHRVSVGHGAKVGQSHSFAFAYIRRMYRENYGIDLRWTRKRPKGPAARVVERGEHVIVQLPDDTVLDPWAPSMTSHVALRLATSLWITATPL
jgi:hypothetical protein